MTDLPYVIDGNWDDAEWRAVAAKAPGTRTEDELRFLWNGPRAHPFGILAHSVEQEDGRVFVFPSKEHADAFAARQLTAAVKPAALSKRRPEVPE